MSRPHRIIANERLFNQWMKVSASPHTKLGLGGASIVQNDSTATSEELNEWYKEVGEAIKETEQHFAEVIQELELLRQRTVEYIKNTNN